MRITLSLAGAGLLLAGAWVTSAGVLAQSAAQELDILHVLIVADTLDERIGSSVLADANNVQSFLRQGIPPERCRIAVLSGAKVQKQNILNYYASVNARPKDGLLFYFAGHGGFRDVDMKEHVLQLHNDQIDRAQVLKAMKDKGTPLVMVLTDCCSCSPKRGFRGKREPVVFGEKARTTTILPGYAQLLFRARGLVDITAADDGEPADGNDRGGYFTQAFREVIDKVKHDSDITWTAFYPQVKSTTFEVAKKFGQPMNGKYQSSRAFHLPNASWGFVVDSQLKVVEVHFGTAAERAGLKAGDRILRVNGRAVLMKVDMLQAMFAVKGNTVRLGIVDSANNQRERVLDRIGAE